MLMTVFGIDTEQAQQIPKEPKEGALFKVITAYGKTFEIRYGYYEESDRYAQRAEPMEIYPNFIDDPQFTDEGIPFATAMQVTCEHYQGKVYEDSVCDNCIFYKPCDELLGVCRCKARRKKND